MVLKSIAGVFGGNSHKREIEKSALIVDQINDYEKEYEYNEQRKQEPRPHGLTGRLAHIAQRKK